MKYPDASLERLLQWRKAINACMKQDKWYGSNPCKLCWDALGIAITDNVHSPRCHYCVCSWYLNDVNCISGNCFHICDENASTDVILATLRKMRRSVQRRIDTLRSKGAK